MANAHEHHIELAEADTLAECPQCRAECFADPETGEATIHRLYINFDEGGTKNPPSSSPAKGRRDAEVFATAKKAKVVLQTLELADTARHVNTSRQSVQKAEEVAKELGDKAIQGLKVGGLAGRC